MLKLTTNLTAFAAILTLFVFLAVNFIRNPWLVSAISICFGSVIVPFTHNLINEAIEGGSYARQIQRY